MAGSPSAWALTSSGTTDETPSRASREAKVGRVACTFRLSAASVRATTPGLPSGRISSTAFHAHRDRMQVR
jgi:hypothetical protein